MATVIKQQMGKCLGKPEDSLDNENCLENEFPKNPRILLSYVRQESQEHAIELKKQLETQGLKNIFLDLNEIECGDDWADVLNNAVLSCQVFIPLVSSRYGITKWTKREVKLADLKDKHIIPINFLDDWPPDCLAIQFACTQYIKWESDAGKIAKRIKDHLKKNFVESDSQINPEDSICPCKRPRYPDDHGKPNEIVAELPNIGIGSLNTNHILSKNEEDVTSESIPKIVISSHSKQKDFTEFIRNELMSEYELDIWSDEFADMSVETCDSFYQNHDVLGKDFKCEADAASIVIIVLSESYCSSKTCKQQAFYCDYSKRVIPIKYGQFETPEWLSDLFKEDKWSTPSTELEWLSFNDNNSDTFIQILKNRILKLID